MNFSRRRFINQSIAGAAAITGIPAIVAGCIPKASGKPRSILKKGDVLLFQGDSITDAGREKEQELANYHRSFGTGYALIAGSALLRNFPEKELKIYNRGISGNKVYQLEERWQKDCLDLKPTVVSILIGINDYWHKRNGNYEGTVQDYEKGYRNLIHRTRVQLPEVKLVLCEPFALAGTKNVDESWSGPLKEYQVAANNLAEEFNAVWVPFQKIFDEALKYAPATYWTTDGVHPSMAGVHLMAEAWLRATE